MDFMIKIRLFLMLSLTKKVYMRMIRSYIIFKVFYTGIKIKNKISMIKEVFI